MTTTVGHVAEFLEAFAPSHLAEDWDNVGLLVGDRSAPVRRVMTCLTITSTTAAEAIQAKADLIVSHHPFPFKAVRQLTGDTAVGRLLLDLIAAKIAVYSPHTAFDSAERGINQRIAEGVELNEIKPLTPNPLGQGVGRFGKLSSGITLAELAKRLKKFLNVEALQVVGDIDGQVSVVGIGCGAAGELLSAASDCGCDCMILGETRFHTCLEAEALGVSLILPGHFASERFAQDCLAEELSRQFAGLEIWASGAERDPISTV